jgi:hypothetical protein
MADVRHCVPDQFEVTWLIVERCNSHSVPCFFLVRQHRLYYTGTPDNDDNVQIVTITSVTFDTSSAMRTSFLFCRPARGFFR